MEILRGRVPWGDEGCCRCAPDGDGGDPDCAWLWRLHNVQRSHWLHCLLVLRSSGPPLSLALTGGALVLVPVPCTASATKPLDRVARVDIGATPVVFGNIAGTTASGGGSALVISSLIPSASNAVGVEGREGYRSWARELCQRRGEPNCALRHRSIQRRDERIVETEKNPQ